MGPVIIMFDKKTIREIDIKNKKVIVRVDFNVPLDDDLNITDDTRIKLSLPTIRYLRKNNAKIILISHLGRPEGKPEDRFRLDPAAKRLGELTGIRVKKFDETFSLEIRDYINKNMSDDEIVIL